MPLEIAVVGAGVVGLSTAVRLQQTLPQARVTIISDRFEQETTSDGAAGIFRPTPGKIPGVPLPILKGWLKDSWDHYNRLVKSPDAGEAGCMLLSGHRFVNDPTENFLEAEYVYCNRRMTEREMKQFPEECQKFKHGWFVTSILTEPRRYMPYLMKLFKQNGGQIMKKKLFSFEELVGQYAVVVNCTGFGSKTLLGDNKLIPIRGQVFKVYAPWVKHLLYTGDEAQCYILPGVDYVTVGGTRQSGDEDTRIRAKDSQEIWDRAVKAMPSLKNAKIVRQWAGLRPFRNPLRLEPETMHFPSGKLEVVHNYGHGAEGVGLSWGTACAASKLVQEKVLKAKL